MLKTKRLRFGRKSLGFCPRISLCSFTIKNNSNNFNLNIQYCNIEKLIIESNYFNLSINYCIINNLIIENNLLLNFENNNTGIDIFSLSNNKINNFIIRNIKLSKKYLDLCDDKFEENMINNKIQNVEIDNIINLEDLCIDKCINNKIIIKNCLDLNSLSLRRINHIEKLEMKNLLSLKSLSITCCKKFNHNFININLNKEDFPNLNKLLLDKCDINTIEISKNFKDDISLIHPPEIFSYKNIVISNSTFSKQKVIKRRRVYLLCEQSRVGKSKKILMNEVGKNEIQKERTKLENKCYICGKNVKVKSNIREYIIYKFNNNMVEEKFSCCSCC